jgi:hypothetical protein
MSIESNANCPAKQFDWVPSSRPLDENTEPIDSVTAAHLSAASAQPITANNIHNPQYPLHRTTSVRIAELLHEWPEVLEGTLGASHFYAR